MFLVDSHCHLDMLEENNDALLARAQENDVRHILNVCVTIRDFKTVLDTALAYPFVSASLGLHPNEQGEEISADELVKLGQPDKVVAVGETGLDYFRTPADANWQRDRFRAHIAAAKALQKPLIVHTRAAKEDTLTILREENATTVGGVMHCFTEDWAMAKAALDLGFYISFSGIVTFKNTDSLNQVAKQVPLSRLLLETDAPYLTPHPFRGKKNEPAYVRYTAAHLATLRGIPLEELAEQTTVNFFNLFKGALRSHV